MARPFSQTASLRASALWLTHLSPTPSRYNYLGTFHQSSSVLLFTQNLLDAGRWTIQSRGTGPSRYYSCLYAIYENTSCLAFISLYGICIAFCWTSSDTAISPQRARPGPGCCYRTPSCEFRVWKKLYLKPSLCVESCLIECFHVSKVDCFTVWLRSTISQLNVMAEKFSLPLRGVDLNRAKYMREASQRVNFQKWEVIRGP